MAADTNSRVTITDIARKTGVSPATVSLVLRDKPGVGPETRQRVLDSAQTLGYTFKPSNRSAAQNGIENIGLMIKMLPEDDPLGNVFYGPVLAGIEAVCRQRQINLLYATLPVDTENIPTETPPFLSQQNIDGLLLVGAYLNDAINAILEQQKAPVVLVDGYASHDPFDAVVIDNLVGAREAVTHLIENGHRHIALLGSQPHAYPSIYERRNGYLEVIAERNLTPYFADSSLNPAEAAQVVTELLTENPQITAIFGCNDEVTIAAMQAARNLGRKIPQDLSVVGFDNIALAQHISPALSTMRVDKMGMGRLAAQLLINRIEYPNAGKVRAVIRPHLIERQSVKKLK